jgi:hypothetical protein
MTLLATGAVLWLTYIFIIVNMTIDPQNDKFSEEHFSLHGETRKIYKSPINYTHTDIFLCIIFITADYD